jgi:hypothetical protein
MPCDTIFRADSSGGSRHVLGRRGFHSALIVLVALSAFAGFLPFVQTRAVHFPVALSGSASINGSPATTDSVITVAVNGVVCATNPARVQPDSAGNWAMVLEYRGACPEPGITTLFIDGRFAAGPFPDAPRDPITLKLPHGSRVIVPQISRD